MITVSLSSFTYPPQSNPKNSDSTFQSVLVNASITEGRAGVREGKREGRNI